ncbi:MAG: bifunctional phosphopantothenoylcysteine decarboxylase/phosphopantothenate--cysteine ligase CoaBC [Desulfotomaculales bacterium]
MLQGKMITLGVTGSIAAYKAAELASLLVKAGAGVQVVMTAAAQKFLAPATFRALTGNPVYTDMFAGRDRNFPHLELGKASLLVVAPATANILAKAAHGLADDLLSTVILAARCPVLFCPAMNVQMYRNPVTQANMALLRKFGYRVMEAAKGPLACGEEGEGRMPEPAAILEEITRLLAPEPDLRGLHVLVTAGGTREPVDPVRYISNRSSGKMGYALARAAAARGAHVTLVSAPVSLPPPPGVRVVPVETAQQMYEAVLELFPGTDIVFKAAAVADYRPARVSGQKIKKEEGTLVLELEKNPDILSELGRRKKAPQVVVGFAAETEDLLANARRKLAGKNVDLLVANDVTRPGAGFGEDTNIVKLVYPGGEFVELPLMEKSALAGLLLDEALQIRKRKLGGQSEKEPLSG